MNLLPLTKIIAHGFSKSLSTEVSNETTRDMQIGHVFVGLSATVLKITDIHWEIEKSTNTVQKYIVMNFPENNQSNETSKKKLEESLKQLGWK